MYAFNTRRVHFFHNSLRVDKGIGSTTSAVFSVFGTPGSIGDLQFRNNLCVSYGGSMAVAVNVNGATPSNVFTSFSHNIHYAPHSGNPFRFNNTSYATLAAWQTATSLDANSVYEDPLVSESNLRTIGALANGTAVPVGTFVDFDNQARSGTVPDRGADEYGSATCTNPTVPTLVYARMQSIGLQWTSPNTGRSRHLLGQEQCPVDRLHNRIATSDGLPHLGSGHLRGGRHGYVGGALFGDHFVGALRNFGSSLQRGL
jgi:hypothetical protein